MRKMYKILIFYGIAFGLLVHFVTNACGNILDDKAHGYLNVFERSHDTMLGSIKTLSTCSSPLPLEKYSQPWHLLFWTQYALSEMQAFATERGALLDDSDALLERIDRVRGMLSELQGCHQMLSLGEKARTLKGKAEYTHLFESELDFFGLPKSIVLCQRSWNSCGLHFLFNCLRFMPLPLETYRIRLDAVEDRLDLDYDDKPETKAHLERIIAILRGLLTPCHGDLRARVQHVLNLVDGDFAGDAEGETGVSLSLWDAVLALNGQERMCGLVHFDIAEPHSHKPEYGLSLKQISQIMALLDLGLKNLDTDTVPAIVISGDGSDMKADMAELQTWGGWSLLQPGCYMIYFTPRRHDAFLLINDDKTLNLYDSSKTRFFGEEFAPALSGAAALERMLELTTPGDAPWDRFSRVEVMSEGDTGVVAEKRVIRLYRVVDEELEEIIREQEIEEAEMRRAAAEDSGGSL
jgi:hypothetical protein